MSMIKEQLISISQTLLMLSEQVDELSRYVQSIPESKPVGSVEKKPRQVKRLPVAEHAEDKSLPLIESVFQIVRRSRKGITVAKLREKTGLESKQVSNALYKLSKSGRIVAKSRGLYVKR